MRVVDADPLARDETETYTDEAAGAYADDEPMMAGGNPVLAHLEEVGRRATDVVSQVGLRAAAHVAVLSSRVHSETATLEGAQAAAVQAVQEAVDSHGDQIEEAAEAAKSSRTRRFVGGAAVVLTVAGGLTLAILRARSGANGEDAAAVSLLTAEQPVA